jgi:hypothetical protein
MSFLYGLRVKDWIMKDLFTVTGVRTYAKKEVVFVRHFLSEAGAMAAISSYRKDNDALLNKTYSEEEIQRVAVTYVICETVAFA